MPGAGKAAFREGELKAKGIKQRRRHYVPPAYHYEVRGDSDGPKQPGNDCETLPQGFGHKSTCPPWFNKQFVDSARPPIEVQFLCGVHVELFHDTDDFVARPALGGPALWLAL